MKLKSILSFFAAFCLIALNASAQLEIPEYKLFKVTISLSIQHESAEVIKPVKTGSSLTQGFVTEKISNSEIIEGFLDDVSASAAMGGTASGWSIVAITEDGEFVGFGLNNKNGDLIDISEFMSLTLRQDGANYLIGLERINSYKTQLVTNSEATVGSYLTVARFELLGEGLILRANGITTVSYTYEDANNTDEIDGKLDTTAVSCRSMFGLADDSREGGFGYSYVTGSLSFSKGVIIAQPAFLADL